jgi:hypothetical protein
MIVRLSSIMLMGMVLHFHSSAVWITAFSIFTTRNSASKLHLDLIETCHSNYNQKYSHQIQCVSRKIQDNHMADWKEDEVRNRNYQLIIEVKITNFVLSKEWPSFALHLKKIKASNSGIEAEFLAYCALKS